MQALLFTPVRSLTRSAGLSGVILFSVWLLILCALLSWFPAAQHWLAVPLCLATYLTCGVLLNLRHDIRQVNQVLMQQQADHVQHLALPMQTSTLAPLMNKLQVLVRNIERVQQEYADRLDEISFSAGELQGSADHLASNTEQQSNAMQSGAAALVEMSQGVENIATLVREAAGMAGDANQLASDGSRHVLAAADDIRRIDVSAAGSADAMHSLSEQSANINGITDLIRAISEQTNLLALNAAIEAARAGEHGRGFAVVADEVRTLAQRSHESANDISRRIEQISAGIEDAAVRIRDMRAMTGRSVDLAGQAQQSLQAIHAQTEALKTHMFSVASNTEQQSQATNEVSRRIDEVHHAATRNSEQALQTARIAMHMAGLTRTNRRTPA
ncbi:methyl-accepting chemotaxis protein [Thalassolituus sp. LLYu03]|uniref:methyl-accepting chemotaxis protein n=1 Tax=Thalassolituus sp. LLYu03 TaxID=3421656 RepID=UPI003D2E97A6